ncbi:MAG: DUF4093 domain-containing protein [Ruthenibacterium lactatiformans]
MFRHRRKSGVSSAFEEACWAWRCAVEAILRALADRGAREKAKRAGRAITYTDLYELGLFRHRGSAGVWRAWLQSLGLPRAFQKSAVQVLNSLYTMRNSYRPCRETVLR